MEQLSVKISGHIVIKDGDTVLREETNDVHPKNMSLVISRGLAHAVKGSIFKIKFGTQGTYIDGQGQIVYRPANVTNTSDDLYNPTYVEVVDLSDAGVGSGNSVTYTTVPNSTNCRVIITTVISANEAYLLAGDGGSFDPEATYFFDEMGLFTEGTGSPSLLNETEELLLTHGIFSPIEHTGNRDLTVIYTLLISVS